MGPREEGEDGTPNHSRSEQPARDTERHEDVKDGVAHQVADDDGREELPAPLPEQLAPPLAVDDRKTIQHRGAIDVQNAVAEPKRNWDCLHGIGRRTVRRVISHWGSRTMAKRVGEEPA